MSSYDLNALSGIIASSQGLAVISNNLANSQTIGFKTGRAEFADMFSGAQRSPGNGVRVETITQSFTQGTVTATGRELDLALDGEGFFVLDDQTGKYGNVYTRNGSFKLDKDGFMTDQAGNKVLGYTINPLMSTESVPVFNTTLDSINLMELNKTPKATEEMTYNINLDGQESNNRDPYAVSDPTATIGSDENLAKLVQPHVEPYGGFPDFSTNKIIYDSLGGEHRLTSNFYKRDVVTADGTNVGSDIIDENGNGVKYTSWIVQFTVEDYNEETGMWETSGYRYDQSQDDIVGGNDPANIADWQTGMIFELRYDMNGNLIDVRSPNDPDDLADVTLPVGVPLEDLDGDPTTYEDTHDPLDWFSVGSQVKLDWMINSPITGARDPLGSEDLSTDPTNRRFNIDVSFNDMTMYAGDYVLRGVTQDGYRIGDLVGITTSREGVIEARYSNGRSIQVAQLAVANFNDLNALEKLGGQMYAESFGSGPAMIGRPQAGGMGTVNSGALEYSNVDTANELVKMIQTQRTYQASAQVLSTSQELTRTILNL